MSTGTAPLPPTLDPPATTAPPSPASGARRRRLWRGTLPRHLALLLTCALLGAPILYALLVATQTNAEVFRPLMLAAIVASLPPIIVFMALQKPFMKGFALTTEG